MVPSVALIAEKKDRRDGLLRSECMKNRKIMIAIAAITMCGTSVLSLAACAHEHDFKWEIVKEATCVEEGLEKGVCAADNEESTRAIPVDVNAHAYKDWDITLPTTSADGKAYKSCLHNSEHFIEITLPKINEYDNSEHYIQSKEVDKDGRFTFTLKSDETISFKPNLYHKYEGEIKLVIAPTYTQMGLASKKCTVSGHENSDGDYDRENSVLIPAIGSGSKSLKVTQTKAPGEKTCGAATVTFTHTTGETVTIENVELPATTLAEDIVQDNMVRESYRTVNNDGTIVTFPRNISKFRNQIGRVEGTVNSGNATTSYSYDFCEGFTYINDVSDNAKYYIYDAVGDGHINGVWEKEGEKPSFVNNSQHGLIDGVSISFSPFGELYYGIDGLVDGILYEKDAGENVSGFLQGSYTKDGKTVFTLKYNKFKQTTNEVNGKDGFVKNFNDMLYEITLEFTVDDSGMMNDYVITAKRYDKSYSVKDENLVLDGGTYEYAENALSGNPIKGYEDGNFYVRPDRTPDSTAVYTGKVILKTDISDPVQNPYDFGDFENITSFKVNKSTASGKEEITENSTVSFPTTDSLTITLDDVVPADLADIASLKAYLVEDGKEDTELHFNSRIVMMRSKNAITFKCRKESGERKIKIVYGNKEFTFIMNVQPVAPESMTSAVYAYDDLAGKNQLSPGTEFTIYANEKLFFDAVTPLIKDKDALTDNSFTATANGVAVNTKGILDGVETAYFSTATPGEYTIVLTSVKSPAVNTTITVKVEAAPTAEEICSGKYVSGENYVLFGADNTVTIKDNAAAVVYSYTYDAGNKTFSLTKTGDGVNAHEYTMSVSEKYNIKLSYTAGGTSYSNVYISDKSMTPQRALADTAWYATAQNFSGQNVLTYVVFTGEDTGCFTTDLAVTEGDKVMKFTYSLSSAGNGYSISITKTDGPFEVGWYCPMFIKTNELEFDGVKITKLKIQDVALTRQVDAKSVSENLVGLTLEGNKDTVKLALSFPAMGKAELNYNGVWKQYMNYSVVATEGGYKLVLENDTSKPSDGMIAYAFSIDVANKNNSITVGKEMTVNMAVGDSDNTAQMVTFSVHKEETTVDKVYKLLENAEYSYYHYDAINDVQTKYTLNFDENKGVAVSFEEFTDTFTYELTEGENGKYFFTFEKVNATDGGPIDVSVSNNNNSWVVVNGDEITQLHIKGVFNSDAVDVDYEKASPLADATVALADTHWEYTHEIEVTVDWDENDEAIKDFVTVKITIDFHSDGSLDITREQSYDFEEDGPTSRTDTNYTWKLKENAEGKFDLEFTYTGTDYEMGECGLYSSTANDGSFITFENGEITGFTFHYDKVDSTELVQMQPATGMGPRSK